MSTLRKQQQEEADTLTLQLPTALLEEKNLEIDQLNQQVLHLQKALDATKENKVNLYSFETAIEPHWVFCD